MTANVYWAFTGPVLALSLSWFILVVWHIISSILTTTPVREVLLLSENGYSDLGSAKEETETQKG